MKNGTKKESVAQKRVDGTKSESVEQNQSRPGIFKESVPYHPDKTVSKEILKIQLFTLFKFHVYNFRYLLNSLQAVAELCQAQVRLFDI